MTVRLGDNGAIVLDGVCPVEDAEPLLQMLQTMPAGRGRLEALQPAAYSGVPAYPGIGKGPDRSVWRRLGRTMAGPETAPKRGLAAEPCPQDAWQRN